jgi:cytochrome c553
MKTALAVVSALTLAAGAGAALAQGPVADEVLAGRNVAAHYCNECHAVEAGATSPLKQAPPMSELYRTFPVERMDLALSAGLIERHSEWLQQKLDAQERKQLTEYLSSFAPTGRMEEPAPPFETRGMRIAAVRGELKTAPRPRA